MRVFKKCKHKHEVLGFPEDEFKSWGHSRRACISLPPSLLETLILLHGSVYMGSHMGDLGQGQLPSALKAIAQRGLLHLVMFISGSKSTAGFHRMVEVILTSSLGSLQEVWSQVEPSI